MQMSPLALAACGCGLGWVGPIRHTPRHHRVQLEAVMQLTTQHEQLHHSGLTLGPWWV